MAVVVTGFRRSGTSMAIKALSDIGLWIGQKNNPDLSRTGDKNPKGFWEYRPFMKMNRSVLESINPDYQWYDEYPYWETKWDDLPDHLYVQAQKLVDDMENERENRGRVDWGFKVPTTSLLLPFWSRVIPDMKIVWMTRHPAESGESVLHGRTTLMDTDEHTFDKGVKLWKHSTTGFLKFVESNNASYIVSEYQKWIQSPEDELHRVGTFCGLNYEEQAFKLATAEITPNLHQWNPETISENGYRHAEQVAGQEYYRVLGLK